MEDQILKSRTNAFISAINKRDISLLQPMFALDVQARSTASDSVLTGESETLRYFNKKFWMLKHNDPINVVATIGHCTVSNANVPCAVLFDGMRKSNVVTLHLNEARQIQTIRFSSQETDLANTRVLAPPVFPDTPVIPVSRP